MVSSMLGFVHRIETLALFMMIQLLSLSDVQDTNIMIEKHEFVTFHVRSETMQCINVCEAFVYIQSYSVVLLSLLFAVFCRFSFKIAK